MIQAGKSMPCPPAYLAQSCRLAKGVFFKSPSGVSNLTCSKNPGLPKFENIPKELWPHECFNYIHIYPQSHHPIIHIRDFNTQLNSIKTYLGVLVYIRHISTLVSYKYHVNNEYPYLSSSNHCLSDYLGLAAGFGAAYLITWVVGGSTAKDWGKTGQKSCERIRSQVQEMPKKRYQIELAPKVLSNVTCGWYACIYFCHCLRRCACLIFVKLWSSLYLSHRPKWLFSAHRQTFLLANMFLLITGCLSAAAPTYFWLVMARALVGLAIGGIVVPFDNLADAWWIFVVNPDWHHQKMMILDTIRTAMLDVRPSPFGACKRCAFSKTNRTEESVPERSSASVCFAIEYFWTNLGGEVVLQWFLDFRLTNQICQISKYHIK